MKDDLSAMLPLSPAALHILLALAAEDRHGYGIIKEVARQSRGHYKLGSGTLYDNLQKLMERGLVDPEKVISHRFPLSQIHKAVEVMTSGQRNKVIVNP